MGQPIRDEHGELAMTDVVERLRAIDHLKSGDPRPGWEELGALGNEAAAEIENLRGQLSSIRAVAGAVSVESFNYADLKRDLIPISRIWTSPKPDPNGEAS